LKILTPALDCRLFPHGTITDRDKIYPVGISSSMLKPLRPGKLWRFDRASFTKFAIILGIEVIIAVFFRDPFIRQWLGDVLVVMGVAYFIHAFVALPMFKIAIGTLILAYAIELLQSFKIIDRLGWQNSQLAHLTIGSTFDWKDLVAYTLGAAILMFIHRDRQTGMKAK
jgi:hypothetical protein